MCQHMLGPSFPLWHFIPRTTPGGSRYHPHLQLEKQVHGGEHSFWSFCSSARKAVSFPYSSLEGEVGASPHLTEEETEEGSEPRHPVCSWQVEPARAGGLTPQAGAGHLAGLVGRASCGPHSWLPSWRRAGRGAEAVCLLTSPLS